MYYVDLEILKRICSRSVFLIAVLITSCISSKMPLDKELEEFLKNNQTRLNEIKSLALMIPQNVKINGPDFDRVLLSQSDSSQHIMSLPDELKAPCLRIRVILKELRVESFSLYNNEIRLIMSFVGSNNWDCKKSITIGTPSDLQSTQMLDSLDLDNITLLLKKTDARVFSAYKQVNATTFLRIVCDH